MNCPACNSPFGFLDRLEKPSMCRKCWSVERSRQKQCGPDTVSREDFIKAELLIRQCGNGVLAVGAITVFNLVARYSGLRFTLLFGLNYPEILLTRAADATAIGSFVVGTVIFLVSGILARQKHFWAFVVAIAVYVVDGFASLAYAQPLLWVIHMSWIGVMLRGAVNASKTKNSVVSA